LKDQLALKFVALRLSSLDDLVESLNRLIKSIKLFQLLFGTSYCSSTDILLFLRFSLLSLKTVADKFTQTFCGVDNQMAITNVELKKILEEIHDYIVKGGNRLNEIAMLLYLIHAEGDEKMETIDATVILDRKIVVEVFENL
jgi:hypothetical protein